MTFYDYVSTYSPAAHLHMLEELAEEMDEADRQDALSVVVSTRNFALRLRHQPRVRRRLLTWACEEERRVHTEVAAAICVVKEAFDGG